MSEGDNEYDDYYYDDGQFEDEGDYNDYDGYDIPTYDELDLEGRYYVYGSREEYNAWRNNEIYMMCHPDVMPPVQSNANDNNVVNGIVMIIVIILAILFSCII